MRFQLYRKSNLSIVIASGLFFFVMISSLWQCAATKNEVSYNEHIRPIFNKKCLSCHGGVRQLGDFSLLFESEAFMAAKSGKKAIVKGSPSNSELYKRITHHDPEVRMPKDGLPLSENEKELIKKWIDQGADWEDHWAYAVPNLQELPSLESEWPDTDLDYFVLDQLNKVELNPAEEASKEILVRRLCLDLTGLAPTEKQVKEFLENNAESAYEDLVDDLLASKHYGERWAAMWLDLARYADSRGYEKDDHRNIWRYRDWVINAFNRDLPFDEFTIEQLAGDLIDLPSKDQLIATAFNRNTMTNDEGGTENEEFRIAAVIDRINTTFEIWQGTTIACVQCHSHPYDPIRHEEYYEVMDIFNQTADQDFRTDGPHMVSYSPIQEEEINEIIDFIKDLEPQQLVQDIALTNTKIKQAIFPKISPVDCDASINTIFTNDGIASNWADPLQSVKDKKFYLVFSDIDMTGLTDISYWYSANGDQARLELRIDSIGGELVSEQDFEKDESNRWNLKTFTEISIPVKKSDGKHDLVLEIINKTGDISEGMLSIGLLQLNYEDKWKSNNKLDQQKMALLDLRKKSDRTPIMQPVDDMYQRKTNVFLRGNFATLGEQVESSVPDAFVTQEGIEPTDRLSFAKWLVSKENPLTARVMVNRFWEQLFGTGIIESLGDLGTQSLSPSNGALLDHMAVRFMDEHKWSVKSLLKEIVMSSAYKQSSIVTPEKLELDPYNRLLSRGSRFRLSAEQIRDQALSVSGLLNDSIGGTSVMPPQPDGVWAVVYNDNKWITPDSDLKYRRGLYTYWKRTAPYPSMMTFDSPSREVCVSRRIRTNTPLQALVTLNDPVYLETAKALGISMNEYGRGDLNKAISYGYKRALVVEPDQEAIDILKDLYEGAKNAIDRNGLTASSSNEEYGFDNQINDPMTVVANAIMNLDGFLMKE